MEVVKDENICHVATTLLGHTLNLSLLDTKIRGLINRYDDRSVSRYPVSKIPTEMI